MYLSENAKIRELQKSQAEELIPDPDQRKALVKILNSKVDVVYAPRDGEKEISNSNQNPIGRVAAISSDGYYLTAYHVVDESPFYIEVYEEDPRYTKLVQAAIREKGYLILNQEEQKQFDNKYTYLEGRIVWFDPKNDLSIVKFDRSRTDFFKDIVDAPDDGALLISSSAGGLTWTRSGQSFEDRVGNGDYFAVGKLISIQRRENGRNLLKTNMIARSGMSGGPVATIDGHFCGIITRVHFDYKGEYESCTVNVMSAEEILNIVRQDRESEEGSGGNS
ncbi:serine protease [Rubellicoccus peritrichatus]|uniref:Serine protease n=1 Tax=Rubellicoccus peritrichatus TaxID=3080537 RepID=A0AAQ3LCR0_9BACT|nr:serine protease [Puniceicoccus sp. CR14]WOO43076.1 serine protease [Puniceicoccus sp. CR14]